MNPEDQTEEAFSENYDFAPEGDTKGMDYATLLVDNIIGIDNGYESFGESLGKKFNEDELGFLKEAAVGAYEGAKEFVTSPIDTTSQMVSDITDSVSRLGTESLDGRLKSMFNVGYQEATDEQVNKAREAVIGDAVMVSGFIPAAKGVTSVAKAAIPGKVKADVVGQMRSLIDGDKEFRTESKKPAQGLSAQAVGAGAKKSSIPFFQKKSPALNMPDATFGTKKISDLFEEDQWDMFVENPDSPWSMVPGEEDWALPIDGYDWNKLGYARNITVDDLARLRLGQVSMEEVVDKYGNDPTPEVLDYVTNRMTRLSNNPDFVDYIKKRNENPDFDAYTALEGQESDNKIVFGSPIPEALSSMAWPNKGKEGYQILSDLRNNPSIRKSELDTVVSDIDPKKRYTLEEAQELVSGNLWNTEVKVLSGDRGETSFDTYQRQVDLQDPEKDYFELIINSRRKGDKPTFEAKGQHFEPSTLAHARASVRVDARGEYILPEEFQADLLQKGYSEPRSKSTRTSPAAVIERKKDKLTSYDEDELDLLKIIGEDRHSNFFDYNSYKDFLEKVGPENLAPGKTQEEILEMLGPTSRTFSSDDLLGLYANFKVGKDIGSVTPNSPEAWDYWDNLKDTYYNVVDTDVSLTEDPGVSAPPIKKIEESVKLTLGALIAEADKRGIDRIVIPPFERIVAKRFTPGTEDYKKALDPKSGFYKTYVKSTQAAIKDLEEEFGRGNISSRPVDLNYRTNSLSDVEEALTRKLGYSPDDGWVSYLDKDFHKDYTVYVDSGGTSPLSSGLQEPEMRAVISQLRVKGFKNRDLDEYIGENFEPFSKFASRKLGADLVVTGTEIDFKGLRGSGYDLRRLRFAKGGVVEDKQMNRLFQEGGIADDGMSREPVTGNEIPPGSMASEVRDDIPTQLSEGEYVVPADVLRYYGVRFFEDLRAQAKQGMMEMEADGRIGGVPVNAQGAPSGGQEDALTPEEEQMLMEALGSDTGGMAMGGYVDQQPLSTPYQDQATMYQAPVTAGMAQGGQTFDRTQFSSGTAGAGIEAKKYINPKTGETRTFNFIGTTALGIIPEDFVPWTQSLADQAAENTKDTSITEQVTGQEGGAGRDNRDTSKDGIKGWADKNSETISTDAYGFATDALGKTSFSDTMVGGILGGGIIGKAIDAAQTADRLSDAAAALAAGNMTPEEASKVQAALDNAVKDLNPITTAMYNSSVKTKTAALTGLTPTTAPTATSAPTGSTAPASAPTAPESGRDVGGKPSGTTSGGLSYGSVKGGGDVSGSISTSGGTTSNSGLSFGSTGNVSATSADSKDYSMGTPAGSPSNSGGYGNQGSENEGRRAEGGLISRVKKKKTTTRKTKGLAGKQ